MSDEIKDQVETIVTSTETDNITSSVDETVQPETTSTSTQNVVETVIVPKTPLEKAYVSSFNQYEKYCYENKTELAIKALNNSIKSMLRENTVASFKTLYNMFAQIKSKITINNRLRDIAKLSKADRAVVETVMMIFNIIGTKSSVDLDKVRLIVKNENFINWCSKKLK